MRPAPDAVLIGVDMLDFESLVVPDRGFIAMHGVVGAAAIPAVCFDREIFALQVREVKHVSLSASARDLSGAPDGAAPFT